MNTDVCSNLFSEAAGVASIGCIVPLLANIIKAVVSLGAVALFVMLLIGGFNFLFSAGDQKKLESARGTVTQALVGIVVMTLAYLIIGTIQKFTGVDISTIQLLTQ